MVSREHSSTSWDKKKKLNFLSFLNVVPTTHLSWKWRMTRSQWRSFFFFTKILLFARQCSSPRKIIWAPVCFLNLYFEIWHLISVDCRPPGKPGGKETSRDDVSRLQFPLTQWFEKKKKNYFLFLTFLPPSINWLQQQTVCVLYNQTREREKKKGGDYADWRVLSPLLLLRDVVMGH